MSSATEKALLSFVKFVIYSAAAAVLAGLGTSFNWRVIGAIGGVAAFKAALTFFTINFKPED